VDPAKIKLISGKHAFSVKNLFRKNVEKINKKDPLYMENSKKPVFILNVFKTG